MVLKVFGDLVLLVFIIMVIYDSIFFFTLYPKDISSNKCKLGIFGKNFDRKILEIDITDGIKYLYPIVRFNSEKIEYAFANKSDMSTYFHTKDDLKKLKDYGFTPNELYAYDFTIERMITENLFTESELMDAGLSSQLTVFNDAKVAAQVLADKVRSFVNRLASSSKERQEEIYNILIQNPSYGGMKKAGITAKELEKIGVPLGKLKTEGFSAVELITEGFTSDQLKQAGFTDNEALAARTRIRVNKLTSSSEQHREEIYNILITDPSPHIMKTAGIKAKELKDMGLSLGELKKAGFTAVELMTEGLSLGELKKAGFTADDLKTVNFSAADLKDAQFTAADLKKAGFKLPEMKGLGFTYKELEDAGFDKHEIFIELSININDSENNVYKGGKSGSSITRKRRLRLKKSRNITRHKGGKKSVRFSARVKLNNGKGNGNGTSSMNKRTRKVSSSSYKLSARRVIKLKR